MRSLLNYPECPRGTPNDCRFSSSGGSTTLAYYPPSVDRNGVNHNPDRNVTTETTTCTVCGSVWATSHCAGETQHTRVT